MTQAETLVQTARLELGVAEDPIGSNLQKYGEAYGWNGVEWCMQFVWWCFREAGLSNLFYSGCRTASCTTLMKWAKNCNQFVTEGYQTGDVFLYQLDTDAYADHTGIYTGEKDANGNYLVIEGNSNNRVQLVSTRDSKLHGAFRPAWEDIGIPESRTYVSVLLPELQKGDTGTAVKTLQTLLIDKGFHCGVYGIDGDFGKDTEAALRRYQHSVGLTVDGICGINTWNKLLLG